MTKEKQIAALAELDGFLNPRIAEHSLWSQWSRGDGIAERANGKGFVKLPDYLTSYDAIIPLIQKQDIEVILQLDIALKSTPAQLCEALLRATGKWVEDEKGNQ